MNDLLGATEAGLADAARTSTAGEAYSPHLPGHRRAMRRALIAIGVAIVDGRADPGARRTIHAALDDLVATQRPSGLFSGGDNGESPPDSAFTAGDVARALRILKRHPVPGLDDVAERLRDIARRLVHPLADGGVHTPNHRWELAAALAALGDVLDERVPSAVAADWLAEGVDIDADGMFSERSANYSAHVSVPSLILLAQLLGRPDVADDVLRNLRATLALLDESGRVETVHSRRQDQNGDFDAEPFLPWFRWAARRTGDGRFAAAVAGILHRGLKDPGTRLIELLDERDPAPLPDPAPAVSRATILPGSGLVRWSDARCVTTVFAGSDFAATGRIASGLANSSRLVRARSGDAELLALRLAPEFFGIGSLRPALVSADAERAVLVETRSTAFYGPLPASQRRADGRYPMSADGRFFAEMAFADRPRHPQVLRTEVDIDRRENGFAVHVAATGCAVPIAVELVFPPDHEIHGVVAGSSDAEAPLGDHLVATAPSGTHVMVRWDGADEPLSPVFYDEGESFTAVGGRDRIAGRRVLIAAHSSRPLGLTVAFLPPAAREDPHG